MFNVPPATLALCLVMVAGYAFTAMFDLRGGGAAFLVFDTAAFRHQFSANSGTSLAVMVSLVGHAFAHSGFGHFATNTLFLLAFGSAVERALGGKLMIGIFLASAIAGALAMAFQVGEAPARLVGASGGAHGVAGAAALTMLRFGGRAARRTGGGLLVFLVGVNLLLALADGGYALLGFQIGWQAHLGGLAAGLLIAFWRLRRANT